MNLRTIATFLLATFISTGCVIHTGGGGGGGGSGGGVGGGGGALVGNVTFQWTFAGGTCSQNPAVASVHITIPGQTLQNSGVYSCLSNNFPGIVLHDFSPGTYSFTITGDDSVGTTLFSGAGNFTVNGDITVTVDLTPAGGPNSYAFLTWTFPPNSSSATPNCTQAGVTTVTYSIDGATPVSVNCADGFNTTGVQTGYVAAGAHSLVLDAYDSSNYRWYTYTGSLTTYAGNPVSDAISFQWGVGGAVVKWTIEDQTGTTVLSCAQAGITTVYVNFSADGSTWLYPGSGDAQPCANGSAIYSALYPGTYAVSVQGTGAGNVVYATGTNPAPGVVVVAGQFPDLSATGQSVANVIIKP